MNSFGVYSRKFSLYFLSKNNKVFGKLKGWKTMVKKWIGKQVMILRKNNVYEFLNKPIENLGKTEGIMRHQIVHHTLQ